MDKLPRHQVATMSLLKKVIALVTGHTTTHSPEQERQPEESQKSSPQNWQHGLDQWEINYANNAARYLQQRLDDLAYPDSTNQTWKETATENDIGNLEEVAPRHPLIKKARRMVEDSRSGNLQMKPSKLPILTAIGSTECKCPYCMAQLEKFPARATKCKQCGKKYFSRKRPFDEQQVILREDELPALEEEWKKDYQIKQMQPRQLDPVWQDRIRIALETECHENPSVEDAARTAFQESIKLILEGVTPRDATDRALEKFSGAFKEQVEIRLWQLQVRSMHGKG